jgi:hypothetical protein
VGDYTVSRRFSITAFSAVQSENEIYKKRIDTLFILIQKPNLYGKQFIFISVDDF